MKCLQNSIYSLSALALLTVLGLTGCPQESKEEGKAAVPASASAPGAPVAPRAGGPPGGGGPGAPPGGPSPEASKAAPGSETKEAAKAPQ